MGTLHEDQLTFFIIFLSILLRMRGASDKISRKNQKAHVVFNNFFSLKSRSLIDNLEKYFRAGQTTDDNMVHAHSTLDTYGYKHCIRICNTYCFSIAIMVVRTRLNVAL